mmetsp:Transcript_30147/g.55009  ORF Transcript_30147/g.55009 Transcript_30147/m.55009 type:complete len:315 (+) Transcript_30147:90-1034(+)
MWPNAGGAGGQGLPAGSGYGMPGGAGMMSMQQALYSKGGYGGGYAGAMYPGYSTMQPYGAGAGGQGMGGQGGCYGAWGYGAGGSYLGGKSNGKGKGKGKGRGKGFFSGEKGYDKGSSMSGAYDPWKPEGGVDIYDGQDPRRAIEIAQRRAKQRDRSAISGAQRCAQQRFEQSLLDRIQGRWTDEADPGCTYNVEGNLCSVSSTANPRVFRNRITLYGGDLCWDARRFWHYLKIDSLPPVGEEVERVEWTPGEGSPPTQPIIWIKAPDQEGEEDDDAPVAGVAATAAAGDVPAEEEEADGEPEAAEPAEAQTGEA